MAARRLTFLLLISGPCGLCLQNASLPGQLISAIRDEFTQSNMVIFDSGMQPETDEFLSTKIEKEPSLGFSYKDVKVKAE